MIGIKGKLRDPNNRSNVVGHFRAKFRRGGHLAGVVAFDNGKIKASGNQKNNTVPIVGAPAPGMGRPASS